MTHRLIESPFRSRALPLQRRKMRAYRNAGNGPVIHTDGKGNAVRGQGRNNFPYPSGRMARSVMTLHRQAERERRDYSQVAYEDMTRDELRAKARDLGLTGYGKMNKAALIEAVRRG